MHTARTVVYALQRVRIGIESMEIIVVGHVGTSECEHASVTVVGVSRIGR